MNISERYASEIGRLDLLVEIHIVDGNNQEVRYHPTANLNALIEETISFWMANDRYDPNADDTEIWNSKGELIWSFKRHYEDTSRDISSDELRSLFIQPRETPVSYESDYDDPLNLFHRPRSNRGQGPDIDIDVAEDRLQVSRIQLENLVERLEPRRRSPF